VAERTDDIAKCVAGTPINLMHVSPMNHAYLSISLYHR
jgi:hypothetical protein